MPWLTISILLPILGGIVVLLLPKERLGLIRWTALAFALANLVVAAIIGLVFAQINTSTYLAGSYQLVESPSWFIASIGFSYNLGVDGISVLLVLLTALLTVVCIGASFTLERKVKNYMAFMLLLSSGIIGVFLATNLFLFYIFWELMLIPAYFLVGSWGGERRIYAVFKFVLYTSVGSLLMLAGIIALGYYHQVAAGGSFTLNLVDLLNTKLDATTQLWLFGAFAAAFAIKVPFVPFHSWLPDTYAEAPAPVTAMLAGAMSKTGTYAFLRFAIPLFPQAAQTMAPYLSILALIGILYCAVLALVQNDLKRLLGYSSISHLGVVMLALFAFNLQSVEGSVMQMVNHGITTAALFLIVGYIEARIGTRRLSDLGGLASRIPVLATVMAIAALSSLGLPGLNSFAGEFVALLGVFKSNVVYGVLATAVVVPAAWYLLRFFQGTMQGPSRREGPIPVSVRKGTLLDIHIHEFASLAPLLALIFYLGLQPLPLTFLMEPSVLNVMQALGSAFVR